MKPLLYVAPNLALFIVLYRMAAAHLHSERPALFVFLCAWLVYSSGLLLVTAIHPVTSFGFARIYFWSTLAVWCVAIPALVRPTLELAERPAMALWLFAPIVVGVFLWCGFAERLRPSISNVALLITCLLAILAGGVFLIASCAVHALDSGEGGPDIILWRGVGAFFLIFGAGSLAARLFGRSYSDIKIVLCAGTIAWLALAWHITPRGDAIVNPEKLVVRSRIFLSQSAACAPLQNSVASDQWLVTRKRGGVRG